MLLPGHEHQAYAGGGRISANQSAQAYLDAVKEGFVAPSSLLGFVP